MLKNIKHIIWDWNGTLLDDVGYCISIINQLLVKNNLPKLSKNQYRNVFTFPVYDYYKSIGLANNEESFLEQGRFFIELYEQNKYSLKLYDETIEILDFFQKLGKKQSILSAYSKNSLIDIINFFQIQNYFYIIEGLDNIYAESKLNLGKKILEKIGVSQEEIVLIGDTLHDYDVAKELGIKCILISNGHQHHSKLSQKDVLLYKTLKDIKLKEELWHH